MKYLTYAAWQKRGRQVQRGETSHKRKQGIAVFGKDQTQKSETRYYDEYGAPMSKAAFGHYVMQFEEYDEEYDNEMAMAFGLNGW